MGEKRLQVVTGGTSGMGLETAKALAKFGPVLVGGRNEKRLEHAIDYLKAAGAEVYGKTCDISNPESVQEFAEYAAGIAPIGNVVNAAGVDFDNASSELIVKINMQGTHFVLEAFLPFVAFQKDIIMDFHLGNGRVINRNASLGNTTVLSFDDLASPLYQSLFAGQIGKGILGIQAIIFLMGETYLRAYHSQIEHLYEMRKIQAGHFHMCLMLSPGSGLPFKAFHIEDVSRLKARQKISCSSKHLETERNSVRIVIGIGFFDRSFQSSNTCLIRIG